MLRNAVLFAVSIVACAAIGCGGDIARSTVRGKVTYKGKPLQEASVVFMASDNMSYPLNLQPDGTYVVPGVARGKVRVVVQVEPERVVSPRPEKASKKAANPEEEKDAARLKDLPPVVQVPQLDAKLGNPETSGLSFELSQPEQEWSIDLK
jgi:hypothetical protein